MRTESSRGLKWLYCLTLITVIFPSGMYGAASWAGLATGGGLFSRGMLLLLIVPIVYRIVLVARDPDKLTAYVSSTRIKILRNLAIFFMATGLIGSFAIFFIQPLALSIFGKPGDSGVAFFVVGIFIYLLSSAGLLGLLMFEASRLFGFEAQLKEGQPNPKTLPPITSNLTIKHPRSAA